MLLVPSGIDIPARQLTKGVMKDVIVSNVNPSVVPLIRLKLEDDHIANFGIASVFDESIFAPVVAVKILFVFRLPPFEAQAADWSPMGFGRL